MEAILSWLPKGEGGGGGVIVPGVSTCSIESENWE